MISIVEIEHYKYNKQNKIGIWIKSLQIYYVDLSAIDFISDDRFCKIKNKIFLPTPVSRHLHISQ